MWIIFNAKLCTSFPPQNSSQCRKRLELMGMPHDLHLENQYIVLEVQAIEAEKALLISDCSIEWSRRA